jgi:hypothetical protein
VLPLGPVFGEFRLAGQLLGLLAGDLGDLGGAVGLGLVLGASLQPDRVPAGYGLADCGQHGQALYELCAGLAERVVVLLLWSRHDLHLPLVGRHRVVRRRRVVVCVSVGCWGAAGSVGTPAAATGRGVAGTPAACQARRAAAASRAASA